MHEYLSKNNLDPLNSINMMNICAQLSDIEGFNFLMEKGLGYVTDSDGFSPSRVFERNSDINGLNAVMTQLIAGRTSALEKFSL